MKNNKKISITMTRSDWATWHQSLNEVIHGFGGWKHSTDNGYTIEEGLIVMNKIQYPILESDRKNNNLDIHRQEILLTIPLTLDELTVLKNAMNAVFIELDNKWEFHTRMGCHIEEAQVLLKQIEELIMENKE